LARPNRSAVQARALLSMAFSLVHRKALFRIRCGATRCAARDGADLIQHFHGQKSLRQAIVTEHSNILRSSAA